MKNNNIMPDISSDFNDISSGVMLENTGNAKLPEKIEEDSDKDSNDSTDNKNNWR